MADEHGLPEARTAVLKTGRSVAVGLAVAALLAAYAVLSFTASLRKGTSFDEGEELAVGYNIWVNHDFRMEGANGDFIKRWATLPFLITQPNAVVPETPQWRNAQAYELGFLFMFRSGNAPEDLLAQGRAMVVLLGVATGALIFFLCVWLYGELHKPALRSNCFYFLARKHG